MIPRFSPNYNLRDVSLCFKPAKPYAVQKLENAFCDITKHSHAIAFRYGRSGLYYLLKSLKNTSEKRYVLMPSYSCVVVAHAIIEAGYEPIFIDNANGQFQPSEDDYINVLNNHGDDIAMVMPTHLFGVTEETKKLSVHIRKTHPDIFILQDCAHGYFGTDNDKIIPNHYGDGAIYGMNISKLVNSVKGGMLTLNDGNLKSKIIAAHNIDNKKQIFFVQSMIARLYVITTYFAFKPFFYSVVYWLQKNTKILSSQTDYYKEDKITLPHDYNGEMSPFEASIGLSSLNRYTKRVENRSRIAKNYTENLLKTYVERELLSCPEYKDGYSWSHYPVICKSISLKKHLINHLGKHGFEIGEIVDYSIADMECYKNKGHAPCPNALHMSHHIINLPLTFAENVDGGHDKKIKSYLEKFTHHFNNAMASYDPD